MPRATIRTVYCVRPATGTDAGVNQALAGLAAEVLPSQVGGNLLEGLKRLPNVIAAIDSARSDPDDLYITTGTQGGRDNAIWPGRGSHGSMRSGQSFAPTISLDFATTQNISLWDYDSVSRDDHLGSIMIQASDQGRGEIAKLASSAVEGSAYYIIYRVD